MTQPNRRRSRTAASLGPKSVLEVETNVERFIYKGEKTRAISFPLGGIGTGSIGLAGNGRRVDWEIFNRPNKSQWVQSLRVKAEHRAECSTHEC